MARNTPERASSPSRLGVGSWALIGLIGLFLVSAAMAGAGRQGASSKPAPATAPAAPEAVVATYIEAARAGDWHAAASLFHSESLAEFKASLLSVLRRDHAQGVREALFPDRTPDQLAALAPSAFFATYVSNRIGANIAVFPGASPVVVGGVPDGTGVRRMLVRSAQPDGSPGFEWEVITLRLERREPEVWRLAVDDRMQRTLAALRTKVESF